MKKYFDKVKSILNKMLPDNPPNFIIIGAQKSGTSSLYHYLSQHPNIIGSNPKELHYFDKWINYGYSIKWYQMHFKSLLKNKIFFEASPSYIYYENVAKNISEFYPNIKMILLLREPIRRAYSAWNMYRYLFEKNKQMKRLKKGRMPNSIGKIFKYFMKNRSKFPTFRESIEIEMELIESNTSKEPAIIRRGLYVNQLKSYYNYFDKDQILVIGFKGFINNTSMTLKKIYDFLDINYYDYSNIKNNVKNKIPYNNEIDNRDNLLLSNYYKPYNIQLFELLGKKINW